MAERPPARACRAARPTVAPPTARTGPRPALGGCSVVVGPTAVGCARVRAAAGSHRRKLHALGGERTGREQHSGGHQTAQRSRVRQGTGPRTLGRNVGKAARRVALNIRDPARSRAVASVLALLARTLTRSASKGVDTSPKRKRGNCVVSRSAPLPRSRFGLVYYGDACGLAGRGTIVKLYPSSDRISPPRIVNSACKTSMGVESLSV